ncbi:translation regulator (Cya5) [Diplocarpon rosae]|nr:translation regulator (Cya5) [Diplocarpon rosae]
MVGPSEQQQGGDALPQRPSVVQTGMPLDFLYPNGTWNFLRQYPGWRLDRQGRRLVRNGGDKIGYRQYTSSAKDTSAVTNGSIVGAENFELDKSLSNEENLDMQLLYGKLGLTRSSDFEEAWRQYSLLELETEKGPLRKPLMQYLSPSERISDAERTVELFTLVDDDHRTPAVYRYAIRAHLRLQNLADAMSLHALGCENLAVPAGSEELLAYLIRHSSWSGAFSVWKKYQHAKARSKRDLTYNIFEMLHKDPGLASQAIDLGEYANRTVGNAVLENSEDSSELISFASQVIQLALLSTHAFSPPRFTSLLTILQQWNLATPQLYEEAFHMLTQLKETNLAVKCYRKARQRYEVEFTRQTLHTLLKIFCDFHSIAGMQTVLDDFFRIYSKPTRLAYRMCMGEFAAQGDAQTVHALFDQLKSSTRESIVFANEFAPVLHVHAKRGEIQKVVSLFREISDVYRLEPCILCWNILISAYGKIHDTDRAYECFENLVSDEKLKPDDYTFGTLMGICANRGDVDRVIGLYKFAEELQVQRSTAMIDCLVISYIRDGDARKAETICEEALKMKLKGTRTRMWNYLLATYAMQRDLATMNRLLQRMSQAGVDYDQYTYSALMQALCMIKQPDRAYTILTDVMKQAGIKANQFHYAVVMGGYLANGEVHKVLHVANRMTKREMRSSASTKLFALQAQIKENEKLMENSTKEEILNRALEMFQGAIVSMDPQDISATARKGAGRAPLDIAYSTMFYRYIIFVFGQCSEFATVDELYENFRNTLPPYRQLSAPLEILYPLMEAKLVERDHDAIQHCWDLSLAKARESGKPVAVYGKMPEDHHTEESAHKILPARQLDLARHLTIYLQSLSIQMKSENMTTTVDGLLEEGFALDNHNWNTYIELLARRQNYQLAFELCENHLMDGWTGWARIRWGLPERNRLPIELRAARRKPRHLRPKYVTILYLARGYLEIQSMAAESPANQLKLDHLERTCPRLVRAITTMQRVDDYMERTVLRGY